MREKKGGRDRVSGFFRRAVEQLQVFRPVIQDLMRLQMGVRHCSRHGYMSDSAFYLFVVSHDDVEYGYSVYIGLEFVVASHVWQVAAYEFSTCELSYGSQGGW